MEDKDVGEVRGKLRSRLLVGERPRIDKGGLRSFGLIKKELLFEKVWLEDRRGARDSAQAERFFSVAI